MKRVGVVAAWQPELEYLYTNYPILNTQNVACWQFRTQKVGDLEVVSVISGVGKVKCSSCTQLVITQFQPEELYMTGVCGGLSEEVHGGDIIVATNSLQHDVTDAGSSVNAMDPYLGRSSVIPSNPHVLNDFKDFATSKSMAIHYGTIVSGDRRIRSTEASNNLRTKFNAIAVDQEIAAFFHVCLLNQKPCFALKAISDKANERTEEDQARYKLKATDSACKMLTDFLAWQK